MNDKIEVLFSWSGGKDSSLALYEILKSKQFNISALITTVTKDYDRVSMHGLRTRLLDEQEQSLNIPIQKVLISKNANNRVSDRYSVPYWTRSERRLLS